MAKNFENGEFLTKSKFKHVMAGMGEHRKLINNHNSSLKEFVHPLTYSRDLKHHPEMVSIPMSYKFQRKFYETYLDLKRR